MMDLKFQKELSSWKKLGFLNPDNLTEEEVSLLPIRYGARAIVLNDDNKVALIKVTKRNYFALVGGGIEDNESIEEGIIRECKEESGYDVSIISPLGYVEFERIEFDSVPFSKIEYREFDFGFLVRTVGESGPLSLTKEEIEPGHEVNYYSIDEAIKIVENELENFGSFASTRSLIFLKEAKNYLENMLK